MAETRALTTGQVASYCGVSICTAIRWIEQGKLKGYHLPGSGDRRVRVADFLAFLRANDMPVPEEFADRSGRVLVVDDEPTVASVIQDVLEPAGFEIRIAPDGFTAGQALESFRPAVMTLDLRMPGLSGLDVLQAVRSSSQAAGVRVLVVSGLGAEDLARARRSGADDVLAKPFSNDLLLAKVLRLAGREAPGAR